MEIYLGDRQASATVLNVAGRRLLIACPARWEYMIGSVLVENDSSHFDDNLPRSNSKSQLSSHSTHS